uniref:PGG domain-containing protein n=1 Tax=Daucus carota subsp. sativus TaxID=79200 RepID=A0A166CS11_DAUCS
MELWPASYSASVHANSPYIVVDEKGQNILNLAAAAKNRKEMVEGILEYCPDKYKETILEQQDIMGDTPLHLLFSNGCFTPELIKRKGLDTMATNKDFTPRDMLYVEDAIVEDQVHIKIALDHVQSDQSFWKFWEPPPPSKRKEKDLKFEAEEKKLKQEKHDQRKNDLEIYKNRTNTQILVTALITTVTFTVGFTMPGGLHKSGEVTEGLVVLSRKRAFNAFMLSDALALLMSTSSLFFYFLESMNEDPHQVSLLNASSTVLNILSIIGMMLTFIAGTYVVLSDTPVLALAVCIIGSLFFFLILMWIIKMAYDRWVKEIKD